MARDAVGLTVGGPHGDREVRISSPKRVLWPELGITKHELAEYLVAVGEAFVAANGDRPVSLQRFPEGVDGEQFFSKNPPKGAPDVRRGGDGRSTRAGGRIRSSSSTRSPPRCGRCR